MNTIYVGLHLSAGWTTNFTKQYFN